MREGLVRRPRRSASSGPFAINVLRLKSNIRASDLAFNWCDRLDIFDISVRGNMGNKKLSLQDYAKVPGNPTKKLKQNAFALSTCSL